MFHAQLDPSALTVNAQHLDLDFLLNLERIDGGGQRAFHELSETWNRPSIPFRSTDAPNPHRLAT